jgi:hypothetical protein
MDMTKTNNDVVRNFGKYMMKLSPRLTKDEKGNIINDESTAQVTVYDISLKNDLLYSITLQLQAAHAALKIFEDIGYFQIKEYIKN